jgi:hypothetical protein
MMRIYLGFLPKRVATLPLCFLIWTKFLFEKIGFAAIVGFLYFNELLLLAEFHSFLYRSIAL